MRRAILAGIFRPESYQLSSHIWILIGYKQATIRILEGGGQEFFLNTYFFV